MLCCTHANSPLKLIARVREAQRRVWLWHCRKGETKQKNGTFDKEMARAMGEECGPIEKYSPPPPLFRVCVDHKAKHCYTIETGSIELVQTRRGSSIVWRKKKFHISFFFVCVFRFPVKSLNQSEDSILKKLMAFSKIVFFFYRMHPPSVQREENQQLTQTTISRLADTNKKKNWKSRTKDFLTLCNQI